MVIRQLKLLLENYTRKHDLSKQQRFFLFLNSFTIVSISLIVT